MKSNEQNLCDNEISFENGVSNLYIGLILTNNVFDKKRFYGEIFSLIDTCCMAHLSYITLPALLIPVLCLMLVKMLLDLNENAHR